MEGHIVDYSVEILLQRVSNEIDNYEQRLLTIFQINQSHNSYDCTLALRNETDTLRINISETVNEALQFLKEKIDKEFETAGSNALKEKCFEENTRLKVELAAKAEELEKAKHLIEIMRLSSTLSRRLEKM